jgi:hypothetical protein
MIQSAVVGPVVCPRYVLVALYAPSPRTSTLFSTLQGVTVARGLCLGESWVIFCIIASSAAIRRRSAIVDRSVNSWAWFSIIGLSITRVELVALLLLNRDVMKSARWAHITLEDLTRRPNQTPHRVLRVFLKHYSYFRRTGY